MIFSLPPSLSCGLRRLTTRPGGAVSTVRDTFRQWKRGSRANARRSGRLTSLLSSLRPHQESVDALALEVESTFLAIGRQMEEVTRASETLQAQSAAFGQFAGESQSGGHAVEPAVELIRHSLDVLQDCLKSTRGLLEGLNACDAQISRLQQDGHDLERAFSSLRVIEMFFKVESASLPESVQRVFRTLTQEMSSLQVQVETGFGQQFEHLATLKASIHSLIERVSTLLSAQQERSTRRSMAIEAAISALQSEQCAHAQKHAGIAEQTTAIDREIGVLVTTLQFQDITRQKMQHVQTAIGELMSAAADGSTENSETRVRQTCRLEVEQVTGILSDLRTATSRLDEGMGRIEGRLEELDRLVQNDRRNDDVGKTVLAVAATLSATIDELRELAVAGSAGADECLSAVASFASLTESVAGGTEAVAGEIRLIALNAQVQAAQIAEAAALDVLARQTCLTSDAISTLSTSVSKEFSEVNARLRQFSSECVAVTEKAADHRRMLDADGRRIQSALEQSSRAAVEALEGLRTSTTALRSHARAWSELNLGALTVDSLEELRIRLGEIADECSSGAESASDPEGDFAALAQRYTTEAERRIHAEVLAESRNSLEGKAASDESEDDTRSKTRESTQPKAAPEPVAAPTADPLGDNVELF